MILFALKILTPESKDQFMSQKVALICGVSGQDIFGGNESMSFVIIKK
jgi:hypothetical protein